MIFPLDILMIAVACFAAYLVYTITEPVLRRISTFQATKAVAFAVSMLTLLAIVALGRASMLLLLVPFAALGIALVGLYSLRYFAARSASHKPPAFESYYHEVKKAGCAVARRIQQELDRLWRQ